MFCGYRFKLRLQYFPGSCQYRGKPSLIIPAGTARPVIVTEAAPAVIEAAGTEIIPGGCAGIVVVEVGPVRIAFHVYAAAATNHWQAGGRVYIAAVIVPHAALLRCRTVIVATEEAFQDAPHDFSPCAYFR